MLMLGRALTAVGTPGDEAPSCRYCTPGRGTVPAGDEADPAWLAHLYLCRGLSTYAIGELTGLNRQHVTRMLRKARVPLRPRGAERLRPLRRDDPPGLRQLLQSPCSSRPRRLDRADLPGQHCQARAHGTSPQ